MINLQEVYDFISQAFQKSHDYFKWGDKAIFKGSLKNLPVPEIIDTFDDGDYFAVVDIGSIDPENAGHQNIFKPNYSYEITLIRKGKVGDILKTRDTMVNKFAQGWYEFWLSKHFYYRENTQNILPAENELEAGRDLIVVQFIGTISTITTKGGPIHG